MEIEGQKSENKNVEQDSVDRIETSFLSKTLEFYKLGIPSMLCNIALFLQEVMNLYTAGHMPNPTIMAGIGLGNMTQNLFAVAFIESLNSVIQTLGSQAFGSGNLRLCGIYLNRGRLL